MAISKPKNSDRAYVCGILTRLYKAAYQNSDTAVDDYFLVRNFIVASIIPEGIVIEPSPLTEEENKILETEDV